jgi:hypothetical protein
MPSWARLGPSLEGRRGRGTYGTRSYAAMISCTGPDHIALAELEAGLSMEDAGVLGARREK